MDRRLHQIGGGLLSLGAIAGIIGGAIYSPPLGPPTVLADIGADWRAAQIAIGLAGTLFILSTPFLVRHFANAEGEGWAMLGSGFLLLLGAAMVGAALWETRDLSGLFAAPGLGAGSMAEEAFSATAVAMGSMAKVSVFLVPLAVLWYSVGMGKDARWPGWLAWTGALIAIGSMVAILFGGSPSLVSNLPLVLGTAWFLLLGTSLVRQERVPAADAQPEIQPSPDVGELQSEEPSEVASEAPHDEADAVAPSEAPLEDPIPQPAPTAEPVMLGASTSEPAWPLIFEFATDEEAERTFAHGWKAHAEPSAVRSRVFREWLSGPH